jgi:hypothetical protein
MPESTEEDPVREEFRKAAADQAGGEPEPATAGTPGAAAWPAGARPTGDPAVDAVLEALAGIGGEPVPAHAGFYTDIHDALLAELKGEA